MTAGADWRIGIDVGGSKISAVLMHCDGSVHHHLRTTTPRNDYPATVTTISGLVHELDGRSPETPTVGVGIPGSLNPDTGLVRNANSTWLNGRNFKADLATSLGRPIRMANDADCFALSEAYDGAGAGHPVVWGIIVGTGVGSGIVVGGNLLTGPLAIGGEWGHNPLPRSITGQSIGDDTTVCWCGRSGCIESWVSGPAIAADHARIAGASKSPEEIFAAAESGDDAARQAVANHLHRLARAMAGVINIIDPDIIVMGGGIGTRASLCAALPEQVAPHLFSDSAENSDRPVVTVRPAQWGDDSGVRGAARLWNDGPEQ